MGTIDDLILSAEEIYKLTRYRRAFEQLRALAELGIPAKRMHDNTVRVLRMHLIHPATVVAKPPPKLRPLKR